MFALGGLGEVGMNCLALEQDGRVLLVDCGVTFDARGLGVELVHPDFGPLEAWRDRISGVFLTHGHEDHIGALPYLLGRHDVPVWGPPYALGLVRERLEEHEVLAHARLFEARPGERIACGPFAVEPIRVTHSIADATSLAITTAIGTVIHTGDFKVDPAPSDGEHFDEARFTQLGDAGVALLFSDSTNVDREGETGGEQGVASALRDIVLGARGTVFVALFASNVHRLRALGSIARETGRRVVLCGRSLETHARVAAGTGYLEWPSDLLWPRSRLRELPRDGVLALLTGTQGEARGALARLASGGLAGVSVEPGETVVLSSRVIPGNERQVSPIVDGLLRRGARVRSWVTDPAVHVSGHGHRPDQRRMLDLVRPRLFVPVHGTYHHLLRHAELARAAGVEQALVLENGDVAETDGRTIRTVGKVESGRVFVHGTREVPPCVLHERAQLAQEGVVVVVVVRGVRGVRDEVRIETHGVVDETREARRLDEAAHEARAALARAAPEGAAEAVRLAVRHALFRATGTKPATFVQIVDGGDETNPAR